MTVMHTTLRGATNSFGLAEANAMAHKAWRDLQRARNARNSNDCRDAVLDCALTSWHLIDWTWAGITQVGRHEPELARLLGVRGRAVEKTDLIVWAERECPELILCQSICNGTKHVNSERPVDTQALEPSEESRGVARLVIIDKTVTHDALDVLDAVVSFWGKQVTNRSVML